MTCLHSKNEVYKVGLLAREQWLVGHSLSQGSRRRGAAGGVPVFEILERNGVVEVTVVSDVTDETLLGLSVKTVRRGSIVYRAK
jgi:transposase-like protein